VLHGDQLPLREVVTELLLKDKGPKLAFRYAACGCGDMVVGDSEGASVQPRGCGHRLCPRCGRRRGAKYAQRIIGWLAHESHGDLWSVVLTQQVRKGESLKDARDRLAVKQRRFMRWLSRRGLVAAMTTAHIVWSKSSDGWHYHTHVLAELPAGEWSVDRLLSGWKEAAKGEYVETGEEQARLVVAAGEAVAELRDDAGDSDFWSESKGPVARAVQYPLRDLAQGVSAWRLGGDMDRVREAARELLRSGGGWKLFRAWGRWTKVCPAALVAVAKQDQVEAEERDKAGAAPKGEPEGIDTVHRLYRRARAGEYFARKVFCALEPTVRNASDFAKRFVAFCRSAWDPPPRASEVCHG
jgi:hypothetical protein